MSSPSPSDLDLVRGLRRRDRQTFARLYDDHHAAVYNLCARMLGDREEAKDVTQDVFLTAFDKPPRADENVRLRAWLLKVATNTCLNRIRGRRRSEPVAETLPAAGDPFEQARTAGFIEASLAAVNERYRAALVLKDLQGLETRELADVLGVSRPAADVLVHRARASFKRAFTALAGGEAVAPANLALALAPLPVPAALLAPPLLTVPAPAPGPPMADPSSAVQFPLPPVGPAAAAGGASAAAPVGGLLAKLGAAATTKAAVIAAGAALAAGGGTAAVKLAGEARTTPSPTHPASVHRDAPGGRAGDPWIDDRHERRHLVAAHLAKHRAGTGEHGGQKEKAHDSPGEGHDTDDAHASTGDHQGTTGHASPQDAGHATDAGSSHDASEPVPSGTGGGDAGGGEHGGGTDGGGTGGGGEHGGGEH